MMKKRARKGCTENQFIKQKKNYYNLVENFNFVYNLAAFFFTLRESKFVRVRA
jgi:hypothetical protein